MIDQMEYQGKEKKKVEWEDSKLGGLLITLLFYTCFILIISSIWDSKLSENPISNFYIIMWSIISSAFLFAGTATSYLSLIFWNERFIHLPTTEQKISMLQEKIINRYKVEKKGPKRHGITKWDDEWIISKDTSKCKIHVFFMREMIDNEIGIFIRIDPKVTMESDFMKELEDMILQILF